MGGSICALDFTATVVLNSDVNGGRVADIRHAAALEASDDSRQTRQ